MNIMLFSFLYYWLNRSTINLPCKAIQFYHKRKKVSPPHYCSCNTLLKNYPLIWGKPFQVIVISWPHKAKTLTSKSKAKITMLIFLIIHSLLFIPGFYSRKLVKTSEGSACIAREGKHRFSTTILFCHLTLAMSGQSQKTVISHSF